MVGFGFRSGTGSGPCFTDALFWDNDGSLTLTNLTTEAMPTGHSGDESRAEAINNLTDMQVVGTNTSFTNATLWEYDDSTSTWSAIDLQDDVGDDHCLDFFAGHDINDDGWIVVWGGSTPNAYVLVPFEDDCPGDCNEDGEVTVTDLLKVLADWGTTCPVGALCDFDDLADVNFDGKVNVSDILVVVGAWGVCPGGSGSVGSLEDELDEVGLTMDDWEDFEDVMQDENETQATKDNYLCWMTYYIEHCVSGGTVCQGSSGCPGSNPYGR